MFQTFSKLGATSINSAKISLCPHYSYLKSCRSTFCKIFSPNVRRVPSPVSAKAKYVNRAIFSIGHLTLLFILLFYTLFSASSNLGVGPMYQLRKSSTGNLRKNGRVLVISNRPVSSVDEHTATGAGGLGFDSRVSQIGTQCRRRLATTETFLWSCVAQELSRGDGPRHSLHASAKYSECHEGLILG